MRNLRTYTWTLSVRGNYPGGLKQEPRTYFICMWASRSLPEAVAESASKDAPPKDADNRRCKWRGCGTLFDVAETQRPSTHPNTPKLQASSAKFRSEFCRLIYQLTAQAGPGKRIMGTGVEVYVGIVLGVSLGAHSPFSLSQRVHVGKWDILRP